MCKMYPDFGLTTLLKVLTCSECERTFETLEEYKEHFQKGGCNIINSLPNQNPLLYSNQHDIRCNRNVKRMQGQNVTACKKIFQSIHSYLSHVDKAHGFRRVRKCPNTCKKSFRFPVHYLKHKCGNGDNLEIPAPGPSHAITESSQPADAVISEQDREENPPVEASQQNVKLKKTLKQMPSLGFAQPVRDSDLDNLASVVEEDKENAAPDEAPTNFDENESQGLEIDEQPENDPAVSETIATKDVEAVRENCATVADDGSQDDVESLNEVMECEDVNVEETVSTQEENLLVSQNDKNNFKMIVDPKPAQFGDEAALQTEEDCDPTVEKPGDVEECAVGNSAQSTFRGHPTQ